MNKIRNVNIGDLLTFKAADNKYKALLCTDLQEERSPHAFIFAALNYDSFEKPGLENLLDAEFYGRGDTHQSHFKYPQVQLEKMWSIHPEIKPYHLGSYGITIWRKHFLKFRDEFELIGNVNIVDNLSKNGSGGMNASDWEFLKDFFEEKYKTVLPYRAQKLFKVRALMI